jgi:hypothetical protein
MNTLRAATNNVRAYYGLPADIWGEDIVAKVTPIRDWRKHVLEIRSAIQNLVDFINGFESVMDFDITIPSWLDMGTERPVRDVMTQIKTLIGSL